MGLYNLVARSMLTASRGPSWSGLALAKAKPLIKNCPDGHYPEKQRSELGTVNGLANAPNVGFAFGVPASAWASPAAALRIIGEKQRDVGLTRSDPGGRRGTSRRDGGARVGLRGLLGKGVMGSAHYDNGSGDCEAAHRVIIGLTFAFGEEPLRHISTPEEAGVERAWLGMVDPVLDCNGWMLDDTTLLPKFKFGDPDPQDPNLIRHGSEVFHVGEHFDIDRYGRVYPPAPPNSDHHGWRGRNPARIKGRGQQSGGPWNTATFRARSAWASQ